MNKFIIIFSINLLFFLFAGKQINSQSNPVYSDYLSQNLILSVDGGVNYGFSDYQNSSLGPIINTSLEYYPLIIQNARLGFKVYGGGMTLKFNDTRIIVSSNDGLREIPGEIATDAIQIGAVLSFGYALGNYLIPTISAGGTYLKFGPKTSDGKVRPFNKQNVYKKDIIVFTLEGEIKIKISERFSIITRLSYYPTTTDYLDDVSAATGNDSYLTSTLGFSYAFTGNFDGDGDGIKDNIDLCPDDTEDFDGFDDEDGCPDVDNDKDGILDINDKCPSSAEDFDGFQDEDGCPDLDNDGDRIVDTKDKCPDQAEDFDGFGDEDGCPDPDNDGDGILDIDDKCPNEPETKNNFEDEDGCPDSDTQQETFYQFYLRGEDTFSNGSSNVKESAKFVLDEIASYIKNLSGSKWRIEGHMDNQGSVSGIKKFSYNRAKAVYDYLVFKGVAENQLAVYGLGDSFPIGNNDTPEGRNANKRILIIKED